MKNVPGMKKRLGFGCMRLPMGLGVNKREFSKMVDSFLENGFNYFDTAHPYLAGLSEKAIKDCLSSRYPRESFMLCDKLTRNYFKKEEDIRPFFEKQLDACGVSYFDVYLMHSINGETIGHYEACKAFEIGQALKEEGKIRHLGISFHDKATVLDKILQDHPEIEVVQIQFNYADYDDAGIESRKVYEVCEKYDKAVIVMEPVKGGTLANLPKEAEKVFESLNGGSNASYAIRFAASFPQIVMVLSGMSSLQQMKDNISFMKEFKPLDEKELNAVHKVNEILAQQDAIKCTACRYCEEGCPKQIPIPELFACYNSRKNMFDWNSSMYYHTVTNGKGKAIDCIECGKCEQSCPQHLSIRKELKKVAKTFRG